MVEVAVKVLLTAVLVIAISEISKRSTLIGGLVASLPLTSILAFIWLYVDSGDTAKIAELSKSIFWYVLPSLVLFVLLPIMLAKGFPFWSSLLAASAATIVAYLAMSAVLTRAGISL